MRKRFYKYGCLLLAMLTILTVTVTAFPILSTAANSGELPQDGTYLIYSPKAGGVMGPQVEDPTAPAISMVTATVSGSGATEKISSENGGLIFTVKTYDEGNVRYYTFSALGKYLAVSENNGENNEEKLFLQEKLTDYCYFTLEKTNNGYVIYNKTAKYKGSRVCVEYYSGAFTGWTFKSSSSDLFAFRFYPVEDTYGTGYVINPSVNFTSKESAAWGMDCPISFELSDMGRVESCTAEVRFDKSETKKEYPVSLDGKVGQLTVPAEDLYGHTTLDISVSVKSKQAENNTACYTGSCTVSLLDIPSVTDPTPVPQTHISADSVPTISAVLVNAGNEPQISGTVNGKAVKTSLENGKVILEAEELPVGTVRVDVTVKRADGKTAERSWSFLYGKMTVSPYYGQIHSHTAEYSDGAGTLKEAYEHALAVPGLDFLVVTDHSNYFDTTSNATTASATDPSKVAKWLEALTTASSYNGKTKTDGSGKPFLAGYGYEMTWSGGPGHINVFNSSGIVSRNSSLLNNKKDYKGMFAFYDLMVTANDQNCTQSEGSISLQWNHPGPTFGDFGDFVGYTPERDALINLMEVANGSGKVSSVGYGYYPSYEYYDRALSLGWHVAPTIGQDNHKGMWGDSNTTRTVVLTDQFTLEGIYSAFSARHVYATEDSNLSVLYYLDDALQGDIISGYQKDTVSITVSLYDRDAFEKLGTVYVIGEGGKELYKSEYISSNTGELTVELPNTSGYYYVKVVEADGDLAFTAPVWVTDAPVIVDPPVENSSAEHPSGVPTEENPSDTPSQAVPSAPDSGNASSENPQDADGENTVLYVIIIAVAVVMVVVTLLLLKSKSKKNA